ncbi:oligoendopeptidase F [Peribacillus deserti]|uniref:Oligopeptidase F n=1 Tax=Peribacillus deserti TaxID=673318 RepID=A0ABS2QFP0_9BACI|nr:oligoendopeptidase F [Peribacillus deserti]MBM7691519.1 oligoendopeptidase F [Peribacillus deserti]
MSTFKSRIDVPEQHKWNLDDIYPSIEDWENDYKRIESSIPQLREYQGRIENGADLLEYLKKSEEISAAFQLVYAYSRLQQDLDTRDSNAQSLLDRASLLSVKLSEARSFFMPFLLSLSEDVLKTYIAENEGLSYFKRSLLESYRYKEHILSKEKEELLSQIGEAFSAPGNTFGMINNADIKFGEVTDENGEKIELTRGMYSKLIEDDNRERRKEAYQAYYQPYIQLKNSIASTLSANIKNNVVLSKIRKYPSALEKSLFSDMVPKEVYENLISAAKKNIDSLHTYNQLRKNLLDLDELAPYDQSVDLVKGVKQDIPFDEAYEMMLKALSPLGSDYITTLESFKEKRYIDVWETPGKRSGAYNMGLYGVHPFILLNHRNDLNSLFTLTHEMGHAMHSYYSSKHQPRISAGYSIFVAEVASTVNEVLLIHYLLNESNDINMRKYLINHFIDQFKGTFFTQVMFAEFEKITHELAEQGKPLNAEVFNSVYEKLTKEYNGEVLEITEEVKYGWSRIPHFYRPFYVYKYATGFASAISIAGRLLKGDFEVQSAYLDFLKSGSSEYPLELLKKVGVDLTTPEPIDTALSQFRHLIEELSAL